MELYDLISPVEKMLARKADLMKLPLGGTMELTPLCNMNCKMCFIKQNPEEMKKRGRMLTCDEWIGIAKQAKETGVLFLLLTGGEPLIYPEFKRLYTELTDMGFVITINTNGTLIDERMADFFAVRPCRRLNITIYGKDDETYNKLCHNPNGYSQLINALNLLDERKIPYRLNHTITTDNVDDLEYICNLAKERKVTVESTSYLFPPIRRENEVFERLSPLDSIRAMIDRAIYLHGEEQLRISAINELKKLQLPNYSSRKEGLICRAGASGFWMSWNGDLLPCGMFVEPRISLLENHFAECWKYIVDETDRLRMYSGCTTCGVRNICNVCAAGCLCESGSMLKRPEYICQRAEAYYQILKEISK